MNTLGSIVEDIMTSFSTVKITDVLDVLVVAFLFYKGMRLIRSSRVSRIAKGIVVFLVITWLTSVFSMYSLNFILTKILEMGAVALVIMFQPELRRFLEKIGSKSTLKELLGAQSTGHVLDNAITETVTACEIMSKSKTGVLLVFEREMLLDDYFKTGTVLNADTSEQLLRNLFFTKAALHDGAVIVRGGRIAAAACVLPLTDNDNIHADLGTRHRAAVGMSESSDAVVVVVSEETGTISVAINGMLKRHLAPQTLDRLLRTELVIDQDDAKSKSYYGRIKDSLTGKGGHHEK